MLVLGPGQGRGSGHLRAVGHGTFALDRSLSVHSGVSLRIVVLHNEHFVAAGQQTDVAPDALHCRQRQASLHDDAVDAHFSHGNHTAQRDGHLGGVGGIGTVLLRVGLGKAATATASVVAHDVFVETGDNRENQRGQRRGSAREHDNTISGSGCREGLKREVL